MRLKWAINLSLILTGVFLCVFTAFAQEKSLTIWLMPNEPPLSHQPSDNEIKEFLDQNPNLINTMSEIKSDLDFAKAVLGQTQILGLIDKYKQARNFNGNINLRILKWPQAFTEIESAIINEEGSPDILQLGTTWTAYFANKNVLMDISKYVDENMYFEPSIKSCKILGSEKIYALPLNVDVRVLYYWKNLINNPVELEDWDSFNKACKRIQGLIKDKKVLKGMRWAIGFPIHPGEWDMLHQFAIWLWSAGGEIIDSKKRAQLDSKKALESASFLKELTEGVDLHEMKLCEIENRFIAGEVGMIISGGWLAERLKREFGENVWENRIGISLPPAGPGGKYTFVGGCNLGMLKVAKERGNFNQALDFLKFLCQDAQPQYSIDTGILSGLKEAMKDYISSTPSHQIFQEALECGKSYPSIPEWAIIVEKEVTLDCLYRFWLDNIINKKSINIVRLDLEIANQMLNDKFNATPKDISNILYLVIVMMVLGLIGLIIFGMKKKLPTSISKEDPLIAPQNIPLAENSQNQWTITFYLKKTPEGVDETEWVKNEKEFLGNLLNPKNVRVEVKKDGCVLDEVKNINNPNLENHKILFCFYSLCKQILFKLLCITICNC